MPVPDYYRLLGVEASASPRAVRKAYRRALLRYHPDVNAGRRDSEERLRQVMVAGRILCDPRARQEYDRQHSPSPKPSPPQRSIAPGARIALGWRRILARCRRAGSQFLTAAWAEWQQSRPVRRQHQASEFDRCLKKAMRYGRKGAYRLDEDGIYRCQAQRREPQGTWRRSALWLLLGLLLKMAGPGP